MPMALRDALRQRAGARCEYCRMPERFAPLRFQKDHVVALKHRGATAPENLAWSCADCNAHKGSNLAGLDPHTGKLERLFNPRADRWEEHFEWHGAELAGKTAIGRVTVAVLQINREERLVLLQELMTGALWSR